MPKPPRPPSSLRTGGRWAGRPPKPRQAELRGSRAPSGGAEPDIVVLYGWHPVAAALGNPRRRILRLLATENGAARLRSELPQPLPFEPEIVRAEAINRLVEPDAVHQGLYLEAQPLEGPGVDDLGPDALLLALDQITDPHNVGAIVRSAAAFGVTAIITTARHSPGATGVLAKAASGGLEHVPFVVVRNLSDALVGLGERGIRRIGLDSDGSVALAAVPTGRPVVLVLGAEGKGLRQRTRDNCDAIARLETPGAIGSLNVSNAAAIALYVFAARP